MVAVCVRCGYPMSWHAQKEIADQCVSLLLLQKKGSDMAKARRITEGKKAADTYNKIPPPRMGKGVKPQPIKNSYSPRMLKPTRKG